MLTTVRSNLYSSLLISKSLLIFIVGAKRKDHTPRSLDNYWLFVPKWVLLFAIPFLVYKDFTHTGPFEMCQVRMCLKQLGTHSSRNYLLSKRKQFCSS